MTGEISLKNSNNDYKKYDNSSTLNVMYIYNSLEIITVKYRKNSILVFEIKFSIFLVNNK